MPPSCVVSGAPTRAPDLPGADARAEYADRQQQAGTVETAVAAGVGSIGAVCRDDFADYLEAHDG